MKLNISSAVLLSIAFAGGAGAQVTPGAAANSTQYTKSQLKQLAQAAHTPEQYAALATYYEVRQRTYAQQAADEKQEWARRSQNIVSIAAKYPRPVDSARNLYEYYDLMARESGQLSAKYRELSGAGAAGTAK